MKYFAHLNSAVQILGLYQGKQPFGGFIKDFFRQHKKYGSRDRKSIAHLCYCYFRLGKALPQLPPEERVVAGLFLCSTARNEVLEQIKPAWNQLTTQTAAEKLETLSAGLTPQEIFPYGPELSGGLDH